jgi:hypothetical protein
MRSMPPECSLPVDYRKVNKNRRASGSSEQSDESRIRFAMHSMWTILDAAARLMRALGDSA